MRLVISEKNREIVRDVAVEAAYKENDQRPISRDVLRLISVAVDAAINELEEILA